MSERMGRVVSVHRLIGPENAKWQGVLLTTFVCADGSVWEQWGDGFVRCIHRPEEVAG